MAVDAVEERRQVDELVARVDELEIEEFLFALHVPEHRETANRIQCPKAGIGEESAFWGRCGPPESAVPSAIRPG